VHPQATNEEVITDQLNTTPITHPPAPPADDATDTAGVRYSKTIGLTPGEPAGDLTKSQVT